MGSSGFGQIFSKHTQAIFYNWKPNPVQRMLDFDYLCGESICKETAPIPGSLRNLLFAVILTAVLDHVLLPCSYKPSRASAVVRITLLDRSSKSS